MGPLDPATLTSLRELDPGGTRGLLPRLIEAFDRTVQRQGDELDAAMASGPDLARVGRVAHTLKSASAHLAARSLSDQCLALEQLCRQGDAAQVTEAVAALRRGLLEAQSALHALHGQRVATP